MRAREWSGGTMVGEFFGRSGGPRKVSGSESTHMLSIDWSTCLWPRGQCCRLGEVNCVVHEEVQIDQ
jgi:hypothetical protein